jgi:hypothetical protein
MGFTSGDAALVVGATLTGVTSTATAKVVAIVITDGALTGAGVGIVFIDHIAGTFTAGETVTGMCVLDSSQIDCEVMDLPAKSILVTVETNIIRVNWTKQDPTNAAATPASFGHPLSPGQNIEINGQGNVKKFRMINAASANNAIVNVTIKY